MRIPMLTLLITTLSCGAATPSTTTEASPSVTQPVGAGDDTVVASFDGGTLTRKALVDYLGVSLIRLEADYQTQKYDAERNGLNELLAEKLLEAEAARTGAASVDALLETEVSDKIPAPSEAEVQQFYAMMKRRLNNAPLATVRDKIEAELQNRARAERFEAYITQVRDKYKVNISLASPDLPRIPVSADDDPFLGPADAAVTIIQFAEFQCPFCGRAKEAIDQLLKNYPNDVRVVVRDFPLGFHDRAIPAAIAANCAGVQGKYFEMYDKMMADQRSLSDIDLRAHADALNLDIPAWINCRADPSQEAEVRKDMEDGAKVGVTGTPAFFVNGIMLSGAQPYSAFERLVEQELANR